MQVILGGAYNGKRQYVKEQLQHVAAQQVFLFEGSLPQLGMYNKEQYVVIAGFEKLVKSLLHLSEDEIADELYIKIVQLSTETNVICICTDMSRGVVPIEKEQRQLRDTCGRLYQKLCGKSDQVVRIWYGIPQLLKGE